MVADSDKKFKIFLKGEDKTKNVSSYSFIGDKCRVTFLNGKNFDYNMNNVKIIKSCLNNQNAKNCFSYLKELASEVGLTTEKEDGTIINFLKQNYSKIEFVDPDTVFSEFIIGKFSKSVNKESVSFQDVVYPFGFNISQKKAVDNALNNRLSIIEGPPGTGKTQTILNILGNIVMRRESVAVVSSNNSAVKNIFDKLKKNDLDFIVAFLGSKENKNTFIESQKPLPLMNDWKMSNEDIDNLKVNLRSKHEELKLKLDLKIKLSNLKQELSNIQIEEKHFSKFILKNNHNLDLPIINRIHTSLDALCAWLSCEHQKKGRWLFSLISYFFEVITGESSQRMLIHYGLKKYSHEQLIQMFQTQFYILKIQELNKTIDEISKELDEYDFDMQMDQYSKHSLKVFKAELASRYNGKERKKYAIEDLRFKPDDFIKDYPIVLSTSYSLRASLSSEVCYDYLIIDESSQVDICTGALALSCAKNVIIVGDLKQLPHVVDNKKAISTDQIFYKYNLSESYRYKNQSLLSSLTSIFPNAPRTVLREHYRCSPKIIEFCNKKFYDGQLIIMTEPKQERVPLIVYKTVEGNHERNRMNQRQIDIIKEEIIPQQSLNINDESVGIVTPFRNQTNQLRKAFSGTKVKADTVDKFQGQEKNVIILSTVNDDISEFTDNANRLNVAVSRAIDQLIVVVNEKDSLKDTNIGELVHYIEYNNLTIIDSKVHSVFDYLYDSYSKERKEFLIRHNRISNFDSENLMNALIRDILRESRFKKLEFSNHVPLRMIIKDMELLTLREIQYVSNYFSHVDFLIYDKIVKAPKFAVEVDGVSFHSKGTKQGERDELKNEIFSKYGIPLLHFRTDGSNERRKLTKMLESIVGQ